MNDRQRLNILPIVLAIIFLLGLISIAAIFALFWASPIQTTAITIQSSSPVSPELIELAEDVEAPTEVFGKTIVSSYTAKVVGITDGDTIKVLDDDKKEIKIRLESIDTPEKKQAFGNIAKKELSSMVAGKTVRVLKTGEDRYGRTLAFVIAETTNTSAEMIRLGFAWHYKKYSKDDYLAELERNARIGKRGLWADKKPVPPWAWRKTKQ